MKLTVPEVTKQNSPAPSRAVGNVIAVGLLQPELLLPLEDELLPPLDEELLEELDELEELLLEEDELELEEELLLLEDELPELELEDELLLLEEELPEELDELLPAGSSRDMMGVRNASLAVFTVVQSPFKIPPVSPEFGFKVQNVQLIVGLAFR